MSPNCRRLCTGTWTMPARSPSSRPRGQCRILLTLPLGARGDLLKEPDPALHDYIAGRFPMLAHLRIDKANGYVYRLGRHVAGSFWAPGVALVGDAAHATHPAGASGMSLAITGAARLTERIAPVLPRCASDADVDAALEAYDAERRPAARTAVEANHQQALRIWQSDLFRDPDAYAEAINPNAGWGAGNAGWGQDPAALGRGSLARIVAFRLKTGDSTLRPSLGAAYVDGRPGESRLTPSSCRRLPTGISQGSLCSEEVLLQGGMPQSYVI